MQREGWIVPVEVASGARPIPDPTLLTVFWTATLVYALLNGLMYGTRTALFMDVTTARVAATQFTAYMALLNLVTSYSASWQGIAIERWGYPATLTIDGLVGLISLALLPLMAPGAGEGHGPQPSARRTASSTSSS
jgi:hypothetical protein